jgi:hypothetical protein
LGETTGRVTKAREEAKPGKLSQPQPQVLNLQGQIREQRMEADRTSTNTIQKGSLADMSIITAVEGESARATEVATVDVTSPDEGRKVPVNMERANQPKTSNIATGAGASAKAN